MKALLLVDIQIDFLPGGALAVPEGDAVVPVASRLAQAFPLVVATQDWHPPEHVSFATRHPGREPFEVVELEIEAPGGERRTLAQTLWPEHCVQGTRGADLAPGLETRPVEAIFRKGTDPQIDSYSAFFDNEHLKKTALGEHLRGRGVEEVVVAGLAADVCVAYTARDARRLGFRTTVVRDATRGIGGPEAVEATFTELARSWEVRIASAADVLADLRAGRG